MPQKGFTGKFNVDTDTWFNPAAFATPTNYALGNAPRALNLRGATQLNEDFSLSKKTRITEKVGINFRWDVFNAFNRHIWQVPGGPVSGGVGTNTANPSVFGKVYGASGPRVMQMGLKLEW